MRTLQIIKPSCFHQHLRDEPFWPWLVPLVAKRFQVFLVMPNLKPPITTSQAVRAYHAGLTNIVARGNWQPARAVMTVYLTDNLKSEDLEHRNGGGVELVGAKYYPRGLTTNSDSGIADPRDLWTKGTTAYNRLRDLAELRRVLLLHAADGFDAHGNELDPYDQEPHFIRETLPRIIDAHPELAISVEHLSTSVGAAFILKNGRAGRLGCSLTAHHLLLDRRDMLRSGFHPNRFWWPIIQRAEHREALHELVRARKPFVWLGMDSAPHRASGKFNACCSGGVLTSHAGIELYAEAFDAIGALDYLESFASLNGPAFFGVDIDRTAKLTLVEKSWTVENMYFCSLVDDDPVIPFRLNEDILWSVQENSPD